MDINDQASEISVTQDHSSFPENRSFWQRCQKCFRVNKFSKRITYNGNWTWDPRTLVAYLLQSHAFPTGLIPITWKTE